MNWNLISNYIINIPSIYADYKNLERLKYSLQEKNPGFCLLTGWNEGLHAEKKVSHSICTQTINLDFEKNSGWALGPPMVQTGRNRWS